MNRNYCNTGDARAQLVVEVFDELTAATYYGFDFKRILIECPEALEAAIKLMELVKARTAVGRGRAYTKGDPILDSESPESCYRKGG